MTSRVPPPRSPDSPEVLANLASALDLVDIVARQVARTLGAPMPTHDLASYGYEGLLSAARSFEAERGVPFRRWASLRIRGAIIDGLRSQGDLPRHVHRRLRALAAGDRYLGAMNEEAAVSPSPTPESADSRLTTYLAGIATAMAMGFLGESVSGHAEDIASRAMTPEEDLGHEQLLRAMRASIASLPEVERALLERHYFGGVTLDLAARELGLSRSWGSRLHARAIEAIARDLKRDF